MVNDERDNPLRTKYKIQEIKNKNIINNLKTPASQPDVVNNERDNLLRVNKWKKKLMKPSQMWWMTSGITLFTRGGGPPQSFFSSSSPSSSSSHTSASAASKHTLAGAWASFFPPTSTRPCCARCSLRRIEFVLLLENRMCSLTTWCSSRRISATSLGRKHSVYLQK